MKKTILIATFLAFVTYAFGQGTDYLIYKKDNIFIAKHEIDGTLVIENKSIDIVFQQLLANLKEAGGSIELMSGEYPITQQLAIPSHVTISGKGTSTIILIEETTKIESAFYSDSTSKVVIKDLAINAESSTAAGSGTNRSGIIFNHVGDGVVENVSISGMGAYGIWYRDRTFLSEVSGCKISDCKESGIFFQGLRSNSRAGDFVPNLITNCIIYGGKYGIELDGSLVTNIIACEVYMTKSVGFYLHNNSNSTLISGCRTFQIQDDAVRVVNSHELNVSSNIFCWHEGHGIVLDNVVWGNVNGNNFIDNGHINIKPNDGNYSYWVEVSDSLNVFDSLKCGIYATNKTKGISISGNAIFNWGSNPPLKHGIHEDASCSHNVITSNNINYSHLKGVLSEGSDSIENNNISVEDKPFLGNVSSENQKYHRYDPRKVQKFIEETRRQ